MDKLNQDYDKNQEENQDINIDEDQRVKSLSPMTLVFKRFFRNRLAITGLVFIVGMFIFSYLGGWLMPYGEAEVFTKYEEMYKTFAGITLNDELKYTLVEGEEFSSVAKSQFALAASQGTEVFEAEGQVYVQEKIDDDYYIIHNAEEIGMSLTIGKETSINTTDSSLDSGFEEVAKAAIKAKESLFEYNEQKFIVSYGGKNNIIYAINDIALATKNVYDYAVQETENSYIFCRSVEEALRSNMTSFSVDGNDFTIESNEDIYEIIQNGTVYANVSRYQIEPIYDDVFFSLEFKSIIREAIKNDTEHLEYADEDGEMNQYRIFRQNLQWTLERVESTYLIDDYASPSKEHLLGTDGNGMDQLTRIMYGGRISLKIGFLVVIIETIIGIVLGGIAGYFGKFWDNLIMRIVDIFNCIPSLPLIIILGAVMDQLRVEPEVRLNILMFILAILGWPSIARMVRGQILSLREQEFMTATEATGLNISSRIFKHLIPNIIPQLIVICTLSLGGVILTESTLSFLGVGVKFPFASWGNIINAVSNVYVMSNYLFVWIPAGICILITVLGFNFIGDGLRDAFDPKMKR